MVRPIFVRAGFVVGTLMMAGIFLGGCPPPIHEPSDQGWGTLRGRFAYDGAPPPARRLAVSGPGAELCGKHQIVDESLLVDPSTGGIKYIVVYARKVSRVHESYNREANKSAMLEQKNCVYAPRVVVLRLHQPLRIKNRDPVTHICRIIGPVGPGTNVLLPPGAETDARFSLRHYVPVPVTCTFHPWMKAYVLARPEPYAAVSDARGFFEIADLPAGEEIEFQAWHERARGPRGELTAKPEWSQGRFRVTIPRGGVLDLGTVAVPASAFDVRSQGGKDD